MTRELLKSGMDNFHVLANLAAAGQPVPKSWISRLLQDFRENLDVDRNPLPAFADDHISILLGQIDMAERLDNEKAARNVQRLLAGRPVRVIIREDGQADKVSCAVILEDPGRKGDAVGAAATSLSRAMLAAAFALVAADCRHALETRLDRQADVTPEF